MALLDTNRTTFATAEAFGHIGKVIADTISMIAEWNDTRVTRKSLEKLSDRELDDIGLSRGMIDGIARRH
ncbi:DUF1127 domain-containing protein [Thalassococcus sp. BH17M4-6]|uniref:DUF1127 domain-containing protein n=1 Tax=Thalassococcus sp. BH17M4-6 TaxID=3413148 RepID=UPI003BC48F1F